MMENNFQLVASGFKLVDKSQWRVLRIFLSEN